MTTREKDIVQQLRTLADHIERAASNGQLVLGDIQVKRRVDRATIATMTVEIAGS